MLTIASRNIIEVEKVVDVCRRADVFCCISLINNSSIENSDIVPTVIAEKERGRERERERENIVMAQETNLYSPTSFENSSIKELHPDNGIDVVDENKEDANSDHFWCQVN